MESHSTGTIARAMGHVALAKSYMEAARCLSFAKSCARDSRPIFALVAHGFELALKGVLIREGWSEERLMLVGHDLERCLDHVELVDRDMTRMLGSEFSDTVRRLSHDHLLGTFRYPRRLGQDLPDAVAVIDCLERLISFLDLGSLTCPRLPSPPV